jgi:hypothetical protein
MAKQVINFSKGQQTIIDESIRVISVHGKIGNVHWLETEYGATKQPVLVRNRTYQQYIVEVLAEKAFDLIRRLQSAEGIWFDEQPKVEY